MWFPFLVAAEIPAHVTSALDDVDSAIRSASYRVRDELKTAQFDVDQDGHPTSEAVAAAIKDATQAQLAFFAETGDLTGAGAQAGGGSILSVSLPGGSGTLNLAEKQAALVAPMVGEILRGCDDITWAVQYS